jgi:hypothetical protein
MNQETRRVLSCVALIGILATAWFKPLDPIATRQVDAGLKRALVSFATARALNSIISVAQGTQVAVEPGGVGASFAIGQALRPINDLVSQFAELMLAASVAFGVMKVMIAIGSFWPVSVLLSIFVVAWFWFRWRGRASPVWIARILFVLLLVRFGVVLVTVGSDAIFQRFLDSDYAASQDAIAGNTGRLAALTPPETGAETSLKDRITGWWSRNADVGARVEKLKALASELAEHFIRLIVVFLMQTLVLPLVLFWILFRVGRAALDAPLRA